MKPRSLLRLMEVFIKTNNVLINIIRLYEDLLCLEYKQAFYIINFPGFYDILHFLSK